MVKQKKISLRTRHISCFYCIALSLFLLAVILLALSSKQSKIWGSQQNHTPVIISASIILSISVIIFIWVTYYAIGYFRLKKHDRLNNLNEQQNETPRATTTQTPIVIFDNAAFTIDDPITNDSPTNMQTPA